MNTLFARLGSRFISALILVGGTAALSATMGCTPKLSESSGPRVPKGAVFQRLPLHEGRWIFVDSQTETLTVYEGRKPLKKFFNVAFGVKGVGKKHVRGDGVTPRGRFTITDIRPSEKFGHFIALSYPNLVYTEQAFREGRITDAVYRQIKGAIERGDAPPQDTLLGGHIGVHGVGRGDVNIHQNLDWTEGCVALENWQVDQLIRLIRPNVIVEIR